MPYTLDKKAVITNIDIFSAIPPIMSDEQHDYSEIYTPTGNEDERFRPPPGVSHEIWRCNEAPNSMLPADNHVAGTSTATTNTSCRYKKIHSQSHTAHCGISILNRGT